MRAVAQPRSPVPFTATARAVTGRPLAQQEATHLGWSELGFFVLTLVLALIFGAFLSSHHVTDPFLYYDVAFVQSALGQSHLALPQHGPFGSLHYVPGREMLMVQLAGMMGISPQVLQFLPLGDLLDSMVLYLLSRSILRSPLLACLITLYLGLNLSHAAALYSIFAYALALPLFFAFILVTLRLMEHRRPLDVLLAAFLFISANLVHYTVASWFVLLLLGANGAIWLQQRLSFARHHIPLTPAPYLFLAALVVYLVFDDVVYRSFLPLIGQGTLEGSQQRFLGYLSLKTASGSTYAYARAGMIGLLSTLTLVIILAPVIVGFLVDLRQLLLKRAERSLRQPDLAVTFGLVLATLSDSVAYSSRGSVSTKAVSLLLPLVAVMYVCRIRQRAAWYGLAGLLVASSLAKGAVFYASSYVVGPHGTGSPYARALPSSHWIQAHSSRHRITLLADLNLYGTYLVDAMNTPYQPANGGFTNDQYAHVVKPLVWSRPPYLVAIDTRTSQPLTGFLFQLFDPLRHHLRAIGANRRLDLVYDDGSIVLAKPIGAGP